MTKADLEYIDGFMGHGNAGAGRSRRRRVVGREKAGRLDEEQRTLMHQMDVDSLVYSGSSLGGGDALFSSVQWRPLPGMDGRQKSKSGRKKRMTCMKTGSSAQKTHKSPLQ
jgi:hypothetical protein